MRSKEKLQRRPQVKTKDFLKVAHEKSKQKRNIKAIQWERETFLWSLSETLSNIKNPTVSSVDQKHSCILHVFSRSISADILRSISRWKNYFFVKFFFCNFGAEIPLESCCWEAIFLHEYDKSFGKARRKRLKNIFYQYSRSRSWWLCAKRSEN